MILKILSYKNKLPILFLFLFSIAINQYYGNRGVFPIDSFLIFDSGYNITLGNHPFKDYWIITGPLLDYIQSFYFFILGVNWFSYVLHASTINMVITLCSFYFFSRIGLKTLYAFIYSVGVAILAYPNTGTPFVDHHAVIFGTIALYSFTLAILFKKNLYWFVTPILIVLSFFSKQIPSAYLLILFLFIIGLIFFYTKNLNKKNLLYFISGFIFSFLIIFCVFIINGIPFESFLIQYIFYPLSLGNERIIGFNPDFQNLISQFKFIYLSSFPIILVLILLIKNKKKSVIEKEHTVSLILFFLSLLTFIYSQLLTKNQIFIFFLIPIATAVSHAYIIKYFNKKYLIYLILIIFIFSTGKYHMRFNHNKKFMELINADFSLAEEAYQLDKKLKGLKWITPSYIADPPKEIELLINTKKILQNTGKDKIIISDYLFFSSILETKVSSPNKWYDNLSVPKKENKFFEDYKDFFITKIKNNNIKYVYIIKKDENIFLLQFIKDKKCLEQKVLNEILIEVKLNNCIF